jgi:GNAT superfamily N-acetyltransferase
MAREFSPKLSTALLIALLSSCVFFAAWNARSEPRHSLCVGNLPDLQPLRISATIDLSCSMEDGVNEKACEQLEIQLERMVQSIFHTSNYKSPVYINTDIITSTIQKTDEGRKRSNRNGRDEGRSSYVIPVNINIKSSFSPKMNENSVKINHDIGSVDVFLKAEDLENTLNNYGLHRSIVIAVLISAGAACNELPQPLTYEGLSSYPSTCEQYSLPSPPPSSSFSDPTIQKYVESKEYHDFWHESFQHSMNWFSTSSRIHLDAVLAHAPGSSSASSLLSLPDDTRRVFLAFQKEMDELKYFSFTFSFRTALLVNISRANEDTVNVSTLENGDNCQIFTLSDTDIEEISSTSQSAISRGATTSTLQGISPILYVDKFRNSNNSFKEDDDEMIISSSFSLSRCYQNTHAPIPFRKRPFDGDLGRSALQLFYALKDATSSLSSTSSSMCIHQTSYSCKSDNAPLKEYCSSIVPPSTPKIVFYVPNAKKSPLFLKGNSGEKSPEVLYEGINRSCVSESNLWPQKTSGGLRTEAEIKSWGALVILNNEDKAYNEETANKKCSDSAKAAVSAIRRRIGLTGRRIHRVQWDRTLNRMNTLSEQVSTHSINERGEDIDYHIDTISSKINVSVSLLSSVLEGEEVAHDCAFTSSSSSSSRLLSIPERRLLDRLWLNSHLDYVRRALVAACALDASPRLITPLRTQQSAKMARDLFLESLNLIQMNASVSNDVDLTDMIIKKALSKARLSRLFAESVAFDPDVTSDTFMPFPHVLALYFPMWAPMALPLLVAILQGISSFRRKKRKDAALRSTQIIAGGKGTIECSPFDDLLHTNAVKGLYVEGQVMHANKGEEAVMRHMWWTRYVLTGDLSNVMGRYMSRDPAVRGRGSCFFVATISVETLNSILEATSSSQRNSLGLVVSESLSKQQRVIESSMSNGDQSEDDFFSKLLSLRFKCAQRSLGQKSFNGPTHEELQDLFRVPGGPFLSADSKRVYIGTIALLPVKQEEYINAKILIPRASGASEKEIEVIKAKALKEAPYVAEILRVAVSPLMRRCGVATALTTHAEAFARACGYKTAYLSTLGTMEGANNLYLKNGFTLLSPSPQGKKDPFPIGPLGHSQSVVQEIYVCEYEKKLV